MSADRRYLAAPAQATAVDIGTRLGKTIYIGGVPYVAIAGTLVRRQLSEEPFAQLRL